MGLEPWAGWAGRAEGRSGRPAERAMTMGPWGEGHGARGWGHGRGGRAGRAEGVHPLSSPKEQCDHGAKSQVMGGRGGWAGMDGTGPSARVHGRGGRAGRAEERADMSAERAMRPWREEPWSIGAMGVEGHGARVVGAGWAGAMSQESGGAEERGLKELRGQEPWVHGDRVDGARSHGVGGREEQEQEPRVHGGHRGRGAWGQVPWAGWAGEKGGGGGHALRPFKVS